jgi:hypothetical protein
MQLVLQAHAQGVVDARRRNALALRVVTCREQPHRRLVAMVPCQQIGQQGDGTPHVAGRVQQPRGVLQERMVRPRPMRIVHETPL